MRWPTTITRGARQRRWLRRAAWGVGVLLVLAFGAGLGLFLTAQHIPGWYVPVCVADDRSEHQRVRDSLTDAVDRFRAGLAGGRPFEFRISDRTISEWIVARAEIYPESADWLPRGLLDPIVRFSNGRMIVAGRYDRDGWKGILSAHFATGTSRDGPTVRLAGLQIGSLGLPTGLLIERLRSLDAVRRIDPRKIPPGIARLLEPSPAGRERPDLAVALADLFDDADFYVEAVTIAEGELRLTIQPVH